MSEDKPRLAAKDHHEGANGKLPTIKECGQLHVPLNDQVCKCFILLRYPGLTTSLRFAFCYHSWLQYLRRWFRTFNRCLCCRFLFLFHFIFSSLGSTSIFTRLVDLRLLLAIQIPVNILSVCYKIGNHFEVTLAACWRVPLLTFFENPKSTLTTLLRLSKHGEQLILIFKAVRF